MSSLNQRQQQAVRYIDGPLLVLAGAGSGKTSVITRKIAWLIEGCGLKAHHLCAVTFTNKAAREMRQRVGQLLDSQQSRGLKVSTFHTLGLSIIRQELQALGYKPGFSIFDQQDAQALIRDLLIQQHGSDDDQAGTILNQISQWKNDLVSAETAAEIAEGPADMLCAQAYIRYQRALKAYNAMDFDDLILLPVRLLQQNEEVLDRWRRRIRYMLVDEYQDTNSSQYLLVQLLVGHSGKLTVVGDDDQSIYAWRGARPENLQQLQQDYPNLKVVMLEQNYRSTARILKAANQVIDNNPHVFEKKLWSELGYGDPIRIIRCANEDAECERVCNEILDRRLRSNGRFNDFAVLYRSNHQARLLELKLQASQIPYRLSGGTSFFARNEIKDIMAYLRLLVNPDDDNAFLRIINVPRRKIGASTLEALGSYATDREIGLFSACDEMGLASRLPESSLKRLREFHQWMQQVHRNCLNGNPITAIREMIDDCGYLAWLHQNASSPEVADRRMANVDILIESLEKTLRQQAEQVEETVTDDWMEDSGDSDIEAAIAKLVLRDLLERQEEDDDNMDRVQLMTLHAAKGLEFPHVYMIGVEEDILPHRNSIETDMVDEERRLCYVGITRAKRTLSMTYCAKRKQFGEMSSCEPSRFLEELPSEDVEWEGRGDSDPAVNQQRGNAVLSDLRNLFD